MNKTKYRLWDKNKKLMIDLGGFTFFQNPNGVIELTAFSYEGQPVGEDEELLESTGFKDRNGQEIWEKDILVNTAGVVWWVEWQQGKGRWAYVRGGIAENPYPKTGFSLTFQSASKMEKQGNFYENYYLLKE